MDFWTVLEVVLTGVGVLLSVFGVVLGATGPIRRRQRKRIEFVVTRSGPLLTVPPGVSVSFVVEGKAVEQAHLSLIRFSNTGTESFPTSAWEAPLLIELKGSRILSARQVAATPYGMRVGSIDIRSGSVAVQPFLFNPGDVFEVQIVSTGAIPVVNVATRLPGLARIAHRRSIYRIGTGPEGELGREGRITFTAFGIMFVGLIAMASLAPIVSRQGEALTALERAPLVVVAVGIFIAYLGFIRWATRLSARWRPAERY